MTVNIFSIWNASSITTYTGYVEKVKLPTMKKKIVSSPVIKEIASWEQEF